VVKRATMHVEQPLPDVVAVGLDTGFAEDVSTRKNIFRYPPHTAKTCHVAREVGDRAVNCRSLVELGHDDDENSGENVLFLIISIQTLIQLLYAFVDLIHPVGKELFDDESRLVGATSDDPTGNRLMSLGMSVSDILACFSVTGE
jgi:hypothetical protein